MVAAFVAMAQQQQEAKPVPTEAAAPELPVIPDDVLDQILANALALQALNVMLREADIDETIGQLDREAQRKAVAAFILMAWQQQEAKAAGGAGPEFPEVSDDLVLFIFAEARLQDQLRDIMRQLNLSGEPGNLPFETKRAVVAALMEQSGGQPRGHGKPRCRRMPARRAAAGGLSGGSISRTPQRSREKNRRIG